jgi:cytochrome c peroxidase
VCGLVFAAAIAGGAAAQQTAGAAVLSRAEARTRARALAELGRQIFFDRSLSASGRMSCATCHDPAHAFAAPNARAVQPGGGDLTRTGRRAVPSLMYLQAAPPFNEHFYEDEDDGDGSVDNGPAGGLTWDGRVDRLRDQARIPLLSPDEMANASADDVMARVARAPYASELARLFGAAARQDAGAGFDGVRLALEAFQQDARRFYPYTSKYDAYLAGRARLTAAEARGLRAFEDPQKGNCARCHPSRPSNNGLPPQFTDYGFVAIGVPRNPSISANADPTHVDLGLCGPDRTDLMGRAGYCGRFKTPTLRNVATRQTFFHNGAAATLRRAVEFYAERDVQPERWYPRGHDGRVRAFDDLPPRYWSNLDREAPFGGKPGEPPALTPQEIDDLVAFLGTLTDGYDGSRRSTAARRP